MRLGIKLFLVGTALAFVTPRPGKAQFGSLDDLAKTFSDLGFFYNVGRLTPSSFFNIPSTEGTSRRNLSSFGAEFSLVVHEAKAKYCLAEERAADKKGECAPIREMPAKRACRQDTTLKEIRRTTDRTGTKEEAVYDAKLRCDPPLEVSTALYELGFAYSQLNGLRSTLPNLTASAALREKPAITLYRTPQLPDYPLYIGIRTGIIELQDFVLESGGKSFTASPQSVEIGGVAGFVLPSLFGIDLGPMNFFVEGAYMYRNFPTIKWTTNENLPDVAPRKLDLSGWSIGVGLQLDLSEARKKQ
jgi:hypothetical protein